MTAPMGATSDSSRTYDVPLESLASESGKKDATVTSSKQPSIDPNMPLALSRVTASADDPATKTGTAPSRLRVSLPGQSRTTSTAAPQAAAASHAELPPAVFSAQERLRDELKNVSPDGVPTPAQQQAMGKYLDEVSAHLRELSKAPAQAVTPGARQAMANMAAALTSNVLGFFVPTVISAFLPEHRQSLAYSVALAPASVAGTELASVALRKLGGANAQLRLATQNSANAGTYKAILGDAILAISNLLIYGAVGSAIDASSNVNSHAWGAPVRSLASGLAMSVIGQGAISLGAAHTLKRNGVDEAKYLPETTHNRSIPNGIYLTAEPALADRTTRLNKTYELTSRALGAVLGAAVYGLIREAGEKATSNPESRNALNIFAGISLFLLIGSLARTAFTYALNDPAKHANKFGIAGSDVLSQQIRGSAMNEFENLLDKSGVDIRDGKWGAEPAQQFEQAVNVFNGAAFREKGDALQQIDDLRVRLRDAASKLEPGDTVSTGTVKKMAQVLNNAAESLRIAKESAENGTPIQPELQDVGNRIRDVQALLLQSQFQLGGPDQVFEHAATVTELSKTLMPTFAALRQVDRQGLARAFVDNAVEYGAGRMSAQQAVASLGAKAHGRVLVRDIADHMASHPASDDKEQLLATTGRMFNEAFRGQQPGFVGAKLMLLGNMLRFDASKLQSEDAADEGRSTVRNLFDGFAKVGTEDTPENEAALAHAKRNFTAAFEGGQFSLKALKQELTRLKDADALPTTSSGPSDIEAQTGPSAAALARHNYLRALPAAFHEAIEQEAPVERDQSMEGAAENMLRSMWRDQQAMPAVQRGLTASAMSLAIDGEPVKLDHIDQHDAHFHPTSYSGRVNSLKQLAAFMDRSNIKYTNLAGIPSQVYKPTAERKYYANSQHGIDYRDHDMPLAAQYDNLPAELKERFDLSMTGFDITNGANIGQEMKNRMRMNPGAYKAVGEVTLKKEIITGKNPHNPSINSKDTQMLFDACAQRGLPLILHCDRGVPGDKNRYANQVIAAIEEWVGRMGWKGNDILAKKGVTNIPPIVPKIVWAHGAGISRFTAEGADHTRSLDALLSKEKLKDVLSLDLSWDFIAHDILENVHDQLTRAGLSEPIRSGIQNLLKLYKTFAEEGGRADKADDLGDLNLAAVHRQAGENVAHTYFQALADFKDRVKAEMDKPAVRDAFVRLATAHGNQGNNWLYLFNAHRDRLLFGTDALAVGIKAHGDAAYAMNTRVLRPMYDIFDMLGEHDARFKGITEKVATGNYEGVFHHPEVEERRKAYENMIATEEVAEHSTNARPSEFITDGLRRRNVAEADE